MRVLLIVGVVVFVAAFLGAWIAVLLLARKARKARAMSDRDAWGHHPGAGTDGSSRGPGVNAWMPLGAAGVIGATAAIDAQADESRRRSSQGGDGGAIVNPEPASDDERPSTPDWDTAPGDADGGGWGGGDSGGGDGGGGGGGD